VNGRRSRIVRRSVALALTAKPAAAGVAVLAPRVVSAASPVAVLCTVKDLRDQINLANSGTSTTLNLPAGCLYTILNADPGNPSSNDALPPITKTVVIHGNGSTIKRGSIAPHERIFEVRSTGDLSIDHLTLTSGLVDSTGGGAIYNNGGTLTVANSSITGNTVSATGNNLVAKGGGIFNTGTATITDSAISGNSALLDTTSNGFPGPRAAGGGLATKGGTLRVRNTTIANNVVSANQRTSGSSVTAYGGGISISAGGNGGSATATITGTTVSGNRVAGAAVTAGNATAQGGGISQTTFQALDSPTAATSNVTVANSTLAQNTITSAPGTGDSGGSAYVLSSLTSGDTATLENTTVWNNTGTNGAIRLANNSSGGSGVLRLTSTIVDMNTGGNCSGTITGGFHNISYPDACQSGFTHLNPLLASSLANNGGPTETVALLPGSPAIDTGQADACDLAAPAGTVDQRGLPRHEVAGDVTCDVGAFEVQPVVVAVQPAAEASPTPTPTLPKAGTATPQGPSGGLPAQLLIAMSVAAAGWLPAAGRQLRAKARS
jgi:hypothetical protein